MLEDLDVDDVGQANDPQAFGGGQADGGARVSLQYTQGATHAQGEVLVAHGLEHEVERIDRVAAHGVLREVGHKNDRRRLVRLADDLRRLHAVDAGKADVEEVDVARVVALQEFEGGIEDLCLKANALLGAKARKVGAQGVGSCRVVLEYERSVHPPSPFI